MAANSFSSCVTFGACGIARIIITVHQTCFWGAVEVPVSERSGNGDSINSMLVPGFKITLDMDVTSVQEIPVGHGAGEDRLDLLIKDLLVVVQVSFPLVCAVWWHARLAIVPS